MNTAERLNWVDAAKGISILLVVMMYAAYSVGEDTGGIGVLHWVIGYATPFRMPEFFLISGLFLARTLDRDWAHFADKRVVHYLYFYGLWALIHIGFKTALVAGDPALALEYALWAVVQPYGVLWFIYVLAMVSVAVKLMHMARIPRWLGFAGAAVLQIAPVQTGAYAIDQFAAYFVFFYAGYALAPAIFALVEKAVAAPSIALAGLAGWAALNYAIVFWPAHAFHPVDFQMGYGALPGVQIVAGIAGALALCVAAGLLSRLRFMSWLPWLGSKSLVVYVAFALPMSIVRTVLIKLGVADANLLSLAVFAAALAGPLVLYGLVMATGFGRFLFERPAWTHLRRGTNAHTRQAVPAE